MIEQDSPSTLIRAARSVDASSVTEDAWILIEGTKIGAVGGGPDAPAAERVIDLGPATLVPGFIDLHCHGGAQHSYDGDGDGIRSALALHRSHGTTRSVLSLVTNPIPTLVRSLATIRELMNDDPRVLGVHLEGPFISPGNHGAHEAGLLLEPSDERLDALFDAGKGILRQVTIAPELDGALAAIARIVDHGVVAAIGHTVASFDQARAGFDAGATILTHAFNAMPGIHHREPGPIMAAIADERITLELILDGVHVAPIVARTLFCAAPGRVALITDAMAAAGSPDGAYLLGASAVNVVDGIARVDGTDTLAGSTLTQDTALRIAIEKAGASLQQAVTALTAVPAAAIGMADRLGSLAPGFAADIVALTPDLAVSSVWTDGSQEPLAS